MTAAAKLNIRTGSFTFAKNKDFVLESGQKLGPITLAYETYGKINAAKDNVLLICHALTGNAHLAGKLPGEKKSSGWWDPAIGPGKPFDTNKYFIICSNILGGCSGSTGPSSLDPRTNRPYATTFPVITVRDMVKAQHALITDHFGIRKLKAIVGGSIGGMQVLEWAVMYPKMMDIIIPIATTTRLSPQAIAFNKIGRHAIMIDPQWHKGHYYDKGKQIQGLGLARMVAHITYLSEEGMQKKFGRDRVNKNKHDIYTLDDKFQVENYLDYQSAKFMARFDANSYIYLSKAMDLYDLARGYKNLDTAIKRVQAKVLYVYFTSDWLFPEYQSQELIDAFQNNKKLIFSYKVESKAGHDAFLIDYDKLNPILDTFINQW